VQIRSAAVAAAALFVVGVLWSAPVRGADPAAPVPRLKCRAFPTEAGAEVDTRDAATDLGRWVMQHEDQGWVVHGVEWEIGQKATGYPQGYTHVCLTPAS
jgi:hypothetical protein